MKLRSFLLLFVIFTLISLFAFPQTYIRTYTFDATLEGWTSHDASSYDPNLTAPSFGYSSGEISIASPLQLNPTNTNFGYWINNPPDFIAGNIPANSLLRGTFYVSTDQADHTLVPQPRFALRNETAQLNSILQINSINNASIHNTPTTTLRPYQHYFQPHRGNLYPTFDGLAVAFEMINYFDVAGPDEGTIHLDRVVIDRFDLTTISWEQTRDFTLSLWRADTSPNVIAGFSLPDFYKTPSGSDSILGIKSAGDNLNTYGVYVGDADKLSINGLTPGGSPYLYRGVFNVSADSIDLSDVPVTLLGLHQSQVRESTAISISSNLGPDSSPDDFGKTYYVYFKPPLEEITEAPASERSVYGEFDLLNFWENDPYGGLFLNSGRLERTNIDNP